MELAADFQIITSQTGILDQGPILVFGMFATTLLLLYSPAPVCAYCQGEFGFVLCSYTWVCFHLTLINGMWGTSWLTVYSIKKKNSQTQSSQERFENESVTVSRFSRYFQTYGFI